MTTRSWWVAGAVASAMVFGSWFSVQAAPVVPAVKPARKLTNPAGTAKAAAALARFANGQLGTSGYDQRLGKTLGKLPGAKQTAKRLVQAIEAMAPADRGKAFPGVSKADALTTSPFDRVAYDKALLDQWSNLPQLDTTVLAPDPFDPNKKGQYELVYRGARVDKAADPDGVDESAVYFNVMTPGGVSSAKWLPAAGTFTASPGGLTTEGAGQVWASPSWPGGWNSGVVIVTAVVEDGGDLEQRKQEVDLLLQFALGEADEDKVTADRAEVLRREVEDALALLHLANPERWSAKAVQVRKLTSVEYDALYLQPSTPDPAPHKLTAQHDPRGGAYTLFFDIPPPNVTYKTVYVRVKELEALGPDKDALENKIADLGATVSIVGNTSAEATRNFAANKNLVKPAWTVERDVQAGRTVSISIHAFDREPPSDCGCSSSGGWPSSVCYQFCAPPDNKDQCANLVNFVSAYPASYAGPCPNRQTDYDLNPLPDSGNGGWFSTEYHDVSFTFDLATNKLAGDVSGAPGTFTVLGTDGAGNKARVVFEVGVK